MALFRLPEHYVFDYKPLYYDPRKEQRDKKFRQIRKELGVETEEDLNLPYKADISFRDKSVYRAKRERSSTVRLLVILIFLVVFFYFFLYTDLFDKMAQLFVK